MKIGVPSEVKDSESRVAVTPAGVRELIRHGHQVQVEQNAGNGSSIPDAAYAAAGAQIVSSADQVWLDSDLICKVKEPVAQEYPRMRPGQLLFTYLHLAADRVLTQELLRRRVTSVAYETVRLPDGSLPLLAPMSEVAGRLAPQVGAAALTRPGGGRGILLGGVPGVAPAQVVVLGAGVAGRNAATIALGLQARVTVLDRDVARLRQLDATFAGRCQTITANESTVEQAVLGADLVIGAVLIPGAKAPRLVSNQMVADMRPGSALVDISIDQGGCFEDSRPTTHANPTFQVHNSVFYCVANMPGAVAHTSTHALSNVTLPYLLRLADTGWRRAMAEDPGLAAGLNTHDGAVTHLPVAQAHGFEHLAVEHLLTPVAV